MPTRMGALILCCFASLSTGDIQFELSMVVPTALNESQFVSDVLSIANNASQFNETMAPFSSLQILGGSSILCLLGIYCFEDGQYTYFPTPTPPPSTGEGLGAGAVAAICVVSALALAGLLCLACRRKRPRGKGKTVIRATIDWPPDKRARRL